MTFDFGGVESEKAYAMKRFNERRNYRRILRAAEAAAAVALLGNWCFPAAMTLLETAGHWLCRVTAVVDNNVVVFVLINILVITIFVISREKWETESDLYDEYNSVAAATTVVYPVPVERDDSRNREIFPVISTSAEDRRPEKVVTAPTKAIVPVKSTFAADRRPRETVTAEEDQMVCCTEAVTEVKRISHGRKKSERRRLSSTKTKEVHRVEHRRSESSSSATEKVNRSERMSVSGSSAVEGLSSEEFRVTVERFIMEKRRTLVQENDVVVPMRGHNRHFICGSSSSCSALARI